MPQSFLKFDVTLMYLSLVMILAKVSNLLPELLKVMSSLHHLQLMPAVELTLFLTPISLSTSAIGLVCHRAQLLLQRAAYFLKVAQKGGQVRVIAHSLAQMLHC